MGQARHQTHIYMHDSLVNVVYHMFFCIDFYPHLGFCEVNLNADG